MLAEKYKHWAGEEGKFKCGQFSPLKIQYAVSHPWL